MIPIFFYISLSTYIFYLVFKFRLGFIELEKDNYSVKKFWAWIKQNSKKIFFTPELLSIILIIIAVNTDAKVTGVCMVVLYTVLSLLLIRRKEHKLKITKKIIANSILVSLFYLIAIVACSIDYVRDQNSFFIFDNSHVYYILMIILGYFNYLILLLSVFLTNLFNKKQKKYKHIK